MTRHFETGGPSRLPGAPVPFRTAPSVPFEANESDRLIQAAVTKGKDISESLADILRQSSLADNEESHLHEVLSLAEDLRKYQSPVEVTIGFVGDTGVGKSSLINSLLDKEKLAKTAGAGEFGTSFVTEFRRKRDHDNATYTLEIERLEDQEISELLRQSVIDYRRYHIRDLDDDRGSERGEVETLRRKANEAWDTLKAAFGNQDDLTEQLFQDAAFLTDDLIQIVSEWKDQIPWPAEFNTAVAIRTAEHEDACAAALKDLLAAWMWPFIKVTRIYLDAAVLRTGVVLVDLPGFRDINSARVRITEARLYRCNEVFVVADIGRAVTNIGVNDLVVRQLGNNFSGLRRSQGVSIICTKSEAWGQDHEILEAVDNTPGPDGFNTHAMETLNRQLRREENVACHMHLKAKRNKIFISHRNKHVEERLRDHYSTQDKDRTINIYSVSNTLYHDAVELEGDIDRSSANYRSAARIMRESSGIPNLREFIQRLPTHSRIEETRHFLTTRLKALLERFDMWLNNSAANLAMNQPAASELLQDLQAELKRTFGTSVEKNQDDLNDTKSRILRQPLSQGVSRWETAALAAVSKWESWSSPTIIAFWRHEGAHTTETQEFLDWNAEIIKLMVHEVEPREEEFHAECTTAFEELTALAQQGLSRLPVTLDGFDGMNHFIQTFDRRGRNLRYEIDNITTWFSDELQIIFHDLLRTHGTSYVRQHMRPMYEKTDSGPGVTKRRIKSLKLRIKGDRNHLKLFRSIEEQCIEDIEKLLESTKVKFQAVLVQCSVDIEHDLELIRSDEAASSNESDLAELMSDVLNGAKQAREDVLRDFEAGTPQ